MTRTRTSVLTALAAGLIIVGCKGPEVATLDAPSLPDVFPNHSLEQVRSLVENGSDTLFAFKARASVSVRSPQQSARFGSSIDYRRSDSLHLNVKATLGIEAARALVTPDSFFVYDRIKRKLYYGDIQRAGTVLPLPVSASGFFETMLGIEFLPDSGWSRSADSTMYHFLSGDRRTEVSVDPRFWRVSRVVKRNGEGTVTEELTYSEFSEFEGMILPRKVILSRPADDVWASIFYTNLDLNPTSLDLALSYSDSAERVLVR